MRDNNIIINLTGTVYSVQCIQFELQQGAATSKKRIKKWTNTDFCLAENSDTKGNGRCQGHITRDIKNSNLLSQELNYRRLVFPLLFHVGTKLILHFVWRESESKMLRLRGCGRELRDEEREFECADQMQSDSSG